MLGLISSWMMQRKIRKSLDNILYTHIIEQRMGPVAAYRSEPDASLQTRFAQVYDIHPRMRKRRETRVKHQEHLNRMIRDVRSSYRPGPRDTLRQIRDQEYAKLESIFFRNRQFHDQIIDDYIREKYNMVNERMQQRARKDDMVHQAIAYCNRNPLADYRGIAWHIRADEESARRIVKYGLDSGHMIWNYNKRIAPVGMREHMIRSYCTDRRPLFRVADAISDIYGMRVTPDDMREAAQARYGRISRHKGMAERAYIRNPC
jgi:hypothetical protein